MSILSSQYETVIGLEVHAELSTKTKIFCGCKNEFGLPQNTACCPVCTGMPGALPVLNRSVVEYAAKMGLATHCSVASASQMARKNYFYPDLPKAYQISQFDHPICRDGYVEILGEDGEKKKIRLRQIHIEEDAGKLVHDAHPTDTLADYNRCGVPLIEIVSQPDLRSSEEARRFLEQIRLTLLYLGISDCKMQEGSLRCDVNVSVRKKGSDRLGTRCEMKNINSFSAAVHAIDYEANRQIELIEAGEEIHQETRRFDDQKGISTVLRTKEEAEDYRYFPEPDLLTIAISADDLAQWQASLPELPGEKFDRYIHQLGISSADARQITESLSRVEFFDRCVMLSPENAKQAANWILGDIAKYLNETHQEITQTKLTPESLIELIEIIRSGKISGTSGKTVLSEILTSGKSPERIIQEKGLSQISDTALLQSIAQKVVEANPSSVEDYRKGKGSVLGFFVGQCMKETKGQGNPALLKEILSEILSGM
ncbi:MAG: Asp-tRNA(Asn)/Glu-tRNA(Gln) amidotransferase subunit GatB [Oscillospiraceae bacterium]|nr:Asp-tRNA(Asn)/Glu-tRNA(Gln) amidotransferase subunit GatB [Oscillospiraceae bacterium]